MDTYIDVMGKFIVNTSVKFEIVMLMQQAGVHASYRTFHGLKTIVKR